MLDKNYLIVYYWYYGQSYIGVHVVVHKIEEDLKI